MKKVDIIFFFLICLFTIPLVWPFFKSGIPETDDSVYRVVKAAKYYISLHQRQIPPRWVGDINQGLGEPSFVFNHPLTYIFSSVLHIVFNTSIISSLKILYIASIFFLAILMYIFFRVLFSPFASFAGSIVYVWSPYRFVQLFVRGTLEEMLALVFIPLNLIFIYGIVHQKKFSWIFGAFSLGAIILAHFLISFIFIPIFVLFFIVLYAEKLSRVRYKKKFLRRMINFERKERILSRFLLYLLFGFSLASFAFLPAIFEKNYTHFAESMYTVYKSGFLPILGLISFSWNFDVHHIRVGISYYWLVLFFIFWKIYHKRINLDKNYLLWFFLFIFLYPWLLIIQTPLASFLWSVIPLIKNVNFPYIFLTATYFAGAGLVAYLTNRLKSKTFPFIILFFAIVINVSNIRVKNYLNFPDEYLYVYQGIASAFDEFIPIYGEKRRTDLPSIIYPTFSSSTEQIDVKIKEKNYHKIAVNVNAQKKGIFVFNNYYFPGWEATIDGERSRIFLTNGDEQVKKIAGGGNNSFDVNKEANKMNVSVEKGLMAVNVPSGDHQVIFTFRETPLRRSADLLTLVSFTILSVLLVFFSTAQFWSVIKSRRKRKL